MRPPRYERARFERADRDLVYVDAADVGRAHDVPPARACRAELPLNVLVAADGRIDETSIRGDRPADPRECDVQIRQADHEPPHRSHRHRSRAARHRPYACSLRPTLRTHRSRRRSASQPDGQIAAPGEILVLCRTPRTPRAAARRQNRSSRLPAPRRLTGPSTPRATGSRDREIPAPGRGCADGHRRAVVRSINGRRPKGPAYEWGESYSWAGPCLPVRPRRRASCARRLSRSSSGHRSFAKLSQPRPRALRDLAVLLGRPAEPAAELAAADLTRAGRRAPAADRRSARARCADARRSWRSITSFSSSARTSTISTPRSPAPSDTDASSAACMGLRPAARAGDRGPARRIAARACCARCGRPVGERALPPARCTTSSSVAWL